MEYCVEENRVHLIGQVLSEPAFNHKTYGEAFYLVVLGVLRKSGYEDRIRLIISERLMGGRSPRIGELLDTLGQIRTYNREVGGRNKLEITVFVREFSYVRKCAAEKGPFACCGTEAVFQGQQHLENALQPHASEEILQSPEHQNHVELEGFVCKNPVRRTSPLGRDICDLMIAVNRMYHKSDYIPVIAWGRNAAYGESLCVGDKVAIEGRIQSREYRKYTEEGYLVTRTAYEVSVSRIEAV